MDGRNAKHYSRERINDMAKTKAPGRTEFFVAMVPPTATAQMRKVAVRGGKVRFYDPPEVAAMRDKLSCRLALHRPPAPHEGALRLVVRWLFPRGAHPSGAYKATRPDADNLQKALKDEMTKLGYWRDDAQVASELVEKFWAETPGIYVRIDELEGGGE